MSVLVALQPIAAACSQLSNDSFFRKSEQWLLQYAVFNNLYKIVY